MAASTSSSGFDPSLAIGLGISTIGNLVLQTKDLKERRKMEEKLALLSLAQQKELELKLQEVQGNVAKMALLYQELRIDKDRTARSILNKQKYTAFAFVGIGLSVLGIVLFLHKRKNNGS